LYVSPPTPRVSHRGHRLRSRSARYSHAIAATTTNRNAAPRTVTPSPSNWDRKNTPERLVGSEQQSESEQVNYPTLLAHG
jgi:hypothetical protein